jgi:hypothetical protein
MGWVKRFIFVSLGEVVDWQYFSMEVGAMKGIIDVKFVESYKLELTFDDGIEGIIDLDDLVGEGVFSVWEDKQLFQNVKIGTTCLKSIAGTFSRRL